MSARCLRQLCGGRGPLRMVTEGRRGGQLHWLTDVMLSWESLRDDSLFRTRSVEYEDMVVVPVAAMAGQRNVQYVFTARTCPCPGWPTSRLVMMLHSLYYGHRGSTCRTTAVLEGRGSITKNAITSHRSFHFMPLFETVYGEAANRRPPISTCGNFPLVEATPRECMNCMSFPKLKAFSQ